MKYMNLKRFGAAAMTGALALSLAAPAFADDGDTTPTNTTTITGAYEAIDLSVSVPTTGAATINPYGLPFDLTHQESGQDVIDGTISGEQITTGAPLMIYNTSTVALAVSAEVTGAVEDTSGVNLIEDASKVDVAEAAGDDAGNVLKNVAAKFEAFPASSEFAGDPASDWTDELKNTEFAALKSENAVLTAPVLEADETTGKGKTTTGSLVLREGDEGAVQEGGAAFIRLSGSVAKKPTEAWAEADEFTATIAFTFEPAEYVGTVELSAVESVAVGGTAKINVTLPENVKAVYDTIKWTSSKTANVTVADSTKKPTAPETKVDAVIGTVTGVKSGSTKSVITVEFVGDDGITYRGTTEVKCG